MGLDRTRWAEVLVGLEGVQVLEVARDCTGRVHVAVETPDDTVACSGCGSRAWAKDRDRVSLADLPVFGAPVTLVWVKRRWACPDRDCRVGTWTEDRPDIAPARAAMTKRAGLWATREVGAEVHTASYAAGQLGVAWHTVMDAVTYWGQALIEDPARVGASVAVGVDETKFNAADRRRRTTWISAICDIENRQVIDVTEGRQGPELGEWLAEQPSWWLEDVAVTVTDLHEPYRKALRTYLPNAVAVADPFHVVGVANRALDNTRRRVQQETRGHRGRKDDSLYRSRKLLVIGEERLDDDGRAKLETLLRAGDPDGEVYEAWGVKEAVRDLYTMWGDQAGATRMLGLLIDYCATSAASEIRGLARTLKQWRHAIVAWHETGHSNGPVEGLNSLIKKVKRVAAGFRNFTHYRLRILLACGRCNWALLGTPPR